MGFTENEKPVRKKGTLWNGAISKFLNGFLCISSVNYMQSCMPQEIVEEEKGCGSYMHI